MKQITDFYLRSMEQKDAHTFFEKVNGWIRQLEDQKFQPALQQYQQAINIFSAALVPASHNTLTMQISKEEECCDSAWLKIRELTDELLEHPDTQFSDIGKAIDAILIRCGSPTGLSASPKIEALDHLTSELAQNISKEDIIQVDLLGWIIELSRANCCCEELMKMRNIELAANCITLSILSARKNIEKAYQHAVRFINAMSIYNGDGEYADIIDNINQLVEQMRGKHIAA
jgi:hypothetical protein